MIVIFILVVSLIALAVDIYIWARIKKRYNPGKWWTIGYLVYAVLVDTMIIFALISMRSSPEPDSDAMLRAMMWCIAIFFLNAAPKAVYTIISLGDYLVRLFTKRRSAIFGFVGGVLAVLLAVVMIYGMGYGRSTVRVEQVELAFDRLPASFDGLQVVHFSDLHLGTLVNRDRMVRRVVDAVNELSPDIIIQSGDIVNTYASELDATASEILSGMKSRYGVYAVLGNHDLALYVDDTVRYSPAQSVSEIVTRQREMGWILLDNETVYISNGEDSISVSGVGYPNRNHGMRGVVGLSGADVHNTYKDVPGSVFNLNISHTPEVWHEILAGSQADLTMSGHVHSLQIKFRVGEWRWSPAQMIYDRWSGLYEENGRYLYINDGIGYVMFPMRIGAKPEITMYTLRSLKK